MDVAFLLESRGIVSLDKEDIVDIAEDLKM